MPKESIKKTLLVALCVCIVCSLLVSTAAVSLQGRQEENRKLYRIKNILIAAGLPVEETGIKTIYEEKVRPSLIDLESGKEVVQKELMTSLNIETFDIKTVADDPVYGMVIPEDKNLAGIRMMPKVMVIYFIEEEGKISKVVLPVYGKGLWSTMYGFVALDRDLSTIKGFTFYEHAETPGLGGEVDNPRWKKSWDGKKEFDDKGILKIEVIKGRVDISRPESEYKIDGLSGATLTSRGVSNLIRFWLSDRGYGTFLKNLGEELNG